MVSGLPCPVDSGHGSASLHPRRELEEVDHGLHLGSDLRAAWIVEEEPGERHAERFEDAYEALGCKRLVHRALHHIGDAEAAEGGVHQEVTIVDEDAAFDGNLEVLS